MRRFHSYGPVDCEEHFCVPRRALVEQCIAQLVDNPEKAGHYFTIWAPRQTGKTWLMRQVKQEITQRYGEMFTVFTFSFDNLADVFAPTGFDLPVLLRRYKEYLARLKAKGMNPWKEQPRRQTDLHLTEAVGHFHLYAWLQTAIGRRCAVSPEFPTGNGRVDLHIRCGEKRGIIEVKSFVDQYQACEDRQQAARYAKRLGVDGVTLATFVPIDEEAVLQELSVTETIDGVTVHVIAIGWT